MYLKITGATDILERILSGMRTLVMLVSVYKPPRERRDIHVWMLLQRRISALNAILSSRGLHSCEKIFLKETKNLWKKLPNVFFFETVFLSDETWRLTLLIPTLFGYFSFLCSIAWKIACNSKPNTHTWNVMSMVNRSHYTVQA